MELRLKVIPKDGEAWEVETDLSVIVAWERKFKSKAADLAKGIGMEDLAYLAYEAAKAHKITVPAVFDDFVKKIRRIEALETEQTRPTNEAPSDGN